MKARDEGRGNLIKDDFRQTNNSLTFLLPCRRTHNITTYRIVLLVFGIRSNSNKSIMIASITLHRSNAWHSSIYSESNPSTENENLLYILDCNFTVCIIATCFGQEYLIHLILSTLMRPKSICFHIHNTIMSLDIRKFFQFVYYPVMKKINHRRKKKVHRIFYET